MPVGTNVNYYQVTISVPAAGLPTPSYSITATPLTADQQKDTMCASFYVDSTGAQTAKSSGGTVTTSNCW
jgi:Tfp pilus assembly protein PilE